MKMMKIGKKSRTNNQKILIHEKTIDIATLVKLTNK